MGIVRLAKCLKILDSIIECKNRDTDMEKKIHSNRLYMDFVSIVYKIQIEVTNELNYLLFSFILANKQLLNEQERTSKKFKQLLIKYQKIFDINDNIDNFIENINQKSVSKINDEFIKKFIETDNEIINDYIYQNVISFVVDMINSKLIGIEYILIAFDGIPNFGKIQEQRQRRYMKCAYVEFQNKILEQTIESNNELIKARLFYDTCLFKINIKNVIDYVYSKNNNSVLQTNILELLNDNVQIDIINRTYGEGEKILIDNLVNDINIFGNKKSYTFYSPDGDSVILCLQAYIKSFVSNISDLQLTVIKSYNREPTNQLNETNQYIDIIVLFNNIINKIQSIQKQNCLFQHNLTNAEKAQICYDFIFLMNLYGNDFIHSVPTMEISATIIDLLYVYSTFVINKSFLTKIILFSNLHNNEQMKYHIVKMNYENIRQFFIHLANHENLMILDTYLSDTENKHIFRKYFGHLFTFDKLLVYRNRIEQIKKYIYDNYEQIQNMEQYINNLIVHLDNEKIHIDSLNTDGYQVIGIGSLWKKLEIKNMATFVEKLKNKNYLIEKQPRMLYNIAPKRKRSENEVKKLVDIIENDLLVNNKSIDVNNINNADIQKNIENFIFEYSMLRTMLPPHSQIPTTNKDIDLFLLDFRGGKWSYLLNAQPYNIGYDSKTQTVKPFNKELKRYQYEMLGLSNTQITKCTIEYIKTLSWLNDYYLNTNNASTMSHISTWSYNYNRSPFISHIAQYMSLISEYELMNHMDNFYLKNTVIVSKYLTKAQQEHYIYPHNKIINLEKEDLFKFDGKKTRNDTQTNDIEVNKSEYFPDIKKYVNDTIENNNNKYFDSRLCPYFSKCIFSNKQLTFNKLKHMKI